MFNVNRKAILSGIAISASVVLAVIQPPAAYAANPSPPPVAAVKVPPRVSIARLNTRVETLPELASLTSGDLVTIFDDGSVTGQIWEGTYVWRPAGARVSLKGMYARWKDGLVAIQCYTDPADANNELSRSVEQPFATYMEQRYAVTKRDDIANDRGILVPVAQKQVTKRLIAEPTDSTILRIPGNAFLFHKERDGEYTALTDTFEFKSGGKPVTRVRTAADTKLVEQGVQPVAVMYQ